MTTRIAALETLLGASLWGLSALVVRHAPIAAPKTVAPLAREERLPSPSQSFRDSEPPAVVGDAYDHDGAMAAHAKAVASYTLSARLDATLHTVDGQGTLVWENTSSRPASELWFHLYLNAFKNNRTVFLRSPFGAGRSGHGASKWGYIDVKRLAIREMGGADVWPKNLKDATEDPDDETDVRVRLPRDVAPGETITLDFEWKSQLPEIVERTGYMRDFHFVGQWFPKIARREQDGAWVHFPFNAQSEFYADFGTYDVTLDVPKAMVVGATGARVQDDVRGERRILRYHADDVHDFAWTAWERFRETTRNLDGVSVRVLYPPGNDGNAAATLTAVEHGLRYYGARFGKYPYPELTVVHPPAWALAAGGMEYPTLITTGAPWYTYLGSTFVERVTLHELGHQWFYGLVATDEHSWPFLDEGLTTYAEESSMQALYGDGDGARVLGLTVSGEAYLRSSAIDAGHDDIVALPAADFVSFREIGALVYARTGIILSTLGRVYGKAALDRALGRYARRYRFEHPGPKHLLAILREVMGDDAESFARAALLEGGTVDFVAKDLHSLPVRPKAGVFDGPGGRVEQAAPDRAATPSRWASRVLVFRHGSLRVPVDVALTFQDGTRTVRRWDGRGRRQAFDSESESPLVAAQVDPDLRVLLDDDLVNGAVTSNRPGVARIAERGAYIEELLLGVLGP
ncbi:MAG TPA: M1 family metallopeptidase [Polyangiaceae bacterium]|nr:M1 family metallopeptidase [Polyangiaceae bacterium]